MITSIINFIFYHTPVFYLIQPLWRDEAFSYFMAKPNPIQVIINTANDFNPPLYYLLLNFWIKIVGKNDILIRMLSFFFHLGSAYFAYLLGKKLFGKKFAIYTCLFVFLNPMLVYYAFEIRMYSLYAFLTFALLYFIIIKNWRFYTVISILGLYTHSFFSLINTSLLFYYWICKKMTKKIFIRIVSPFIFFLPWMPILGTQFLRSKDSWIFPVDLQLVKSVLGNLFTSYEGTPGNWWNYTFYLSLAILFFSFIAFRNKKNEALLFAAPIFFPLSAILSYSFLFRSIYVNRYLIFITVFEIMIILSGINSIKNNFTKKIIATIWILFLVYFNVIISPYHKKTDFRTLFIEINKIANKDDFIFTKTPISFLESVYYYKDPQKVSVLNPNNIAIPYYIGMNVVFQNVSKTNLPPPPSRTFLISDDGSYEVIIAK